MAKPDVPPPEIIYQALGGELNLQAAPLTGRIMNLLHEAGWIFAYNEQEEAPAKPGVILND